MLSLHGILSTRNVVILVISERHSVCTLPVALPRPRQRSKAKSDQKSDVASVGFVLVTTRAKHLERTLQRC